MGRRVCLALLCSGIIDIEGEGNGEGGGGGDISEAGGNIGQEGVCWGHIDAVSNRDTQRKLREEGHGKGRGEI